MSASLFTFQSPDSVVYLEYNPATLPGKPDASWTRFVLLSDTHNATFAIPDGDVLLHSGDLTEIGTYEELSHTMEWLYRQPHKVKMLARSSFVSSLRFKLTCCRVIAGNHDLTLHHRDNWYQQNWTRWGADGQYSGLAYVCLFPQTGSLDLESNDSRTQPNTWS